MVKKVTFVAWVLGGDLPNRSPWIRPRVIVSPAFLKLCSPNNKHAHSFDIVSSLAGVYCLINEHERRGRLLALFASRLENRFRDFEQSRMINR